MKSDDQVTAWLLILMIKFDALMVGGWFTSWMVHVKREIDIGFTDFLSEIKNDQHLLFYMTTRHHKFSCIRL